MTTGQEPDRVPVAALAARPPVAVRGAAARDAESLIVAAYEAHARDLNAFARSLVREREAAEDVVAEAYARLVREVHAGRAPDDVRGWLYRVVSNLVMSRGRRRSVAQRFMGRLVDRRVAESPEARHLRLDVDPALRDAVLALPPDARVAIVLAARGVSGAEIAATIGRSEAATRTLLTRARQKVRARLEPGPEADG